MDIKEELRRIPQNPGVYLFFGSLDEVIYIGKAINLKNRVRSYFQAANADIPKIRNIRGTIRRFEYIITDTEIEALILECNLIKKYQPKYNVLLKDDKSYPYIAVTIDEDFPRVFSMRNPELEDIENNIGKYFGPYTSNFAVGETIKTIHKIWQLRTCSKRIEADKPPTRPCLNYHIGLCPGACSGVIDKEEYGKKINDILAFIGGKHEEILSKLQAEMNKAAENLEFEKAADLRDKIYSIKHLNESQKLDRISTGDSDIIAFAAHENEALFQVFFIRDGKMTGREHFMVYGVLGIEVGKIMGEFITQFYSGTPFIPKELILQNDAGENESESKIIAEWLKQKKGAKVQLTVPKKGEKAKLLKLAQNNAIITMEQFGEHIKQEEKRTEGALEEIQAALGLPILPQRIEAYDISNIQGFENVGSMVVFEGGKPKRNDYRKFKIKSVTGANDYASMQEMLIRRFRRYQSERDENMPTEKSKFSKLPDLLLIDGGIPQISAAHTVLEEIGLDIPLCGMMKDSKHKTRALLYLGEEIMMPLTSLGFRLVVRIQEEVHRFAVEYHRSLRSKNQTKSMLDDIKGIGDVRKRALFRHFKTIEKIRTAEIEELKAVEGMDIRSAKAVYDFFREISE